MPNNSLFASTSGPLTDTVNEAGGAAYQFGPKHALAQFATTGVFQGTYYTKAEEQLRVFKELADQVDTKFLTKLAIYSRERAFMKDMPAAIVAVLATRDTVSMHKVFHRVINNGRMLRTLFQMIRSGHFGKRSLSYSLQRAFRKWLNDASDSQLLTASIGNKPSLRDILRCARPTPPNRERSALFRYLVGKQTAERCLPTLPAALKRFREGDELTQSLILSDYHFRWDLLSDTKSPLVWKAIARKMGHQALRMNLNTLHRHGVLEDYELVEHIAHQIGDERIVRDARQFPYQYYAAYMNANEEVPQKIKQALHQAAEIACGNIPEFPGPVIVGVDVSGSMGWSVLGNGRHRSKMTCRDVAALFGAAVLRRNPDSVVIPFDTSPYPVNADPGDTILSLTRTLASYGGGGTECSLPLMVANTNYRHRRFAGCILVSDQESWVGPARYGVSAVMTQWREFQRNQRALGERDPKLICIDLQPYGTTQAPDDRSILNVGGFSDAVFSVVAGFLQGGEHFVEQIERVEV